eukprot:gene7313-14911_t
MGSHESTFYPKSSSFQNWQENITNCTSSLNNGATKMSNVTTLTEKDKIPSSISELHGLIEHQKQLRDWLVEVEKRIFELETSYLEETPNGNIVRGWDIENKSTPMRPRQIDEKERIFSGSSYQIWMDSKSLHENEADRKSLHPRTELTAQQSKSKKARKSSVSKKDISSFDDGDEDY